MTSFTINNTLETHMIRKPLQFAIAGALAMGLVGPVLAACAPCAPKTKTNASAKKNPCAAGKSNPCAANPCAAKGKANPCAPKSNPSAPASK